ncbi:hypothetical protein PanWU01x14_285010 [Parasponia andersonii]|uniref:Uncharacterized protein n=1 Tax=Parasponia andersonii TaxID=3476 RepID=A0A2P5AZR5_PARAD|nr:hypothetical protein PanWU01x14_285010 [Parasponia andersonii]
MEVLTQAQLRAQSDLLPGDVVESTEFVVGVEPIDEFQIMTLAVRTRFRLQKVLGSLPRLKSIRGKQDSSASHMADIIATLK